MLCAQLFNNMLLSFTEHAIFCSDYILKISNYAYGCPSLSSALKNLVTLHHSKAMTAMICKIFLIGREGYVKNKMVIKFGAMFF